MAAAKGTRFRGSRLGRIVVLSGPSGAGKSTIAAAIRARRPELASVVSYTTRDPRPDDGVGKSYRYVSREEFERLRDAGELLESATVHGELYGTPRGSVEAARSGGRDVLLEIDPQGARSVKALVPDALTIFIEPPSWEVLEARLRARGTEDEEGLRRRLSTARRELELAGDYEHRVVNDQLERAVEEVVRILERPTTR